MIDYIEKARAGRITALSLHTNGHVMFFPEEYEESMVRRQRERSSVQLSKPMFVRSGAFETGVVIKADAAANEPQETFILTEDLIVDNVMRRAA